MTAQGTSRWAKIVRWVAVGAMVLLPGCSQDTAEVPGPPAEPLLSPENRPKNPGNSLDCSDFRSQREAQDWFDTYFPYYGDVAWLDDDKDGIACEALLNTRDCKDFQTQREAQEWFEANLPDKGDLDWLDGDNDGIACESLP